MRVVVTGASGFLGLTLTLTARQQSHEVLGLYSQHPIAVPGVCTLKVNLAEGGSPEEALGRFQPDWLVHCAAATNVDWCEENPEQTRTLNIDVTRRLALCAGRIGSRFLYISTDAVFDGQRGGYVEEDPCHPLNVYAATKLEGERVVQEILPASSLVVRINLFGWKQASTPTLAEWVIQELSGGRPIAGFSDVVFAPLLVNDLCEILFAMMNRELKGVYHAGSSSSCSKYDFARLLAREFDLPEELVCRANVSQSALRARRPLNTALCSQKLSVALGHPVPSVTDAIQRFRTLSDSGFPARLRQLRGGTNQCPSLK
jgi:dTDP-4-dehydrorhamnose reductase